jgi:hypothetical protein
VLKVQNIIPGINDKLSPDAEDVTDAAR